MQQLVSVKRDSRPKTLYIKRALNNADAFIKWAKEQGFSTVQLPKDLHVTIAYSHIPLTWPKPVQGDHVSKDDGTRTVELFGEDGECAVLRFDDDFLESRWQDVKDLGASWDWDEFNPHVTITWEVPEDLDISKVEPYAGDLIFGPEILAEIDDNWEEDHVEKAEAVTFKQIIDKELEEDEKPKKPKKLPDSALEISSSSIEVSKATSFRDLIGELNKRGARHTRKEYEMIQRMHDTAVDLGATCQHDNVEEKLEVKASDVMKSINCEVIKVDKKLGVVFGWAIISKIDGEDYYDTQGDHIPEEAMLEAAFNFMKSGRQMKIMHEGKSKGSIIFAWPMTGDIAEAMGLDSKVSGLMIGAKPDSKKVLKEFEDGSLTGFSIGGKRIEDEEVDEDV